MNVPAPRRKISEAATQKAAQMPNFLCTKEGRQQVERALCQAQKTNMQLRKDSVVDPKILSEPFTI